MPASRWRFSTAKWVPNSSETVDNEVMSHTFEGSERVDMATIAAMSADEPVVLESDGRAVAVVLSPTRYEELIGAWEDREDIAAFDAAMQEQGDSIPWSDVAADLGWKTEGDSGTP